MAEQMDEQMDEQEIISKVKSCVATALGRDEHEVELESVLSTDLEAESIDYLDITFQLEKSFKITIAKDELFPQKIFQDAKLVQDGVVTPAGLEELRVRMPYANLDEFQSNPRLANIQDLFTVGLLVNYVKAKLAA